MEGREGQHEAHDERAGTSNLHHASQGRTLNESPQRALLSAIATLTLSILGR